MVSWSYWNAHFVLAYHDACLFLLAHALQEAMYGVQVVQDERTGVGILQFHRHRTSVRPQHRTMHLPNRGRSNGNRIKLAEHG